MANYIYGAISLTGGATGSLDSIDGADLQDQDSCIVFTSSAIYFYWLDDDNGGSENSPEIIAPDNNAGNKRWVLIYYRAADVDLDISAFNGVLSGTQDDVQKALELIDDMFASDDFTVATGSVALDDDVLKIITTDSGDVSGTAHTITFNGVNRINTAADGTSIIDISLADLNLTTRTSGPYTILATDDIIIGDTAGGGYTVNLPKAADKDIVRIIKKSNSNTLVIQADGSETIEGSATTSLDAEDDMLTLVSNGNNRWTKENTSINTTQFNGVLSSATDLTIQTAFNTLDDMFDSTAFIVTAGNVDINDSGIDHNALLNTHNLSTDIDHGGLAGKDDDDHPHYVLSNGTRAFTGTVAGITPAAAADLATKDYVDSLLQGLDWQPSVIDRYDPSGGTPAAIPGDRYISTATADGWTVDYIYELDDSTAWIETVPNEGYATWVEDENKQYTYNGSGWVTFGSTTSHNATSGLQGGTSNEYYHLTATNHTDLTDGGDTNLHQHDSLENSGTTKVTAETDGAKITSSNCILESEGTGTSQNNGAKLFLTAANAGDSDHAATVLRHIINDAGNTTTAFALASYNAAGTAQFNIMQYDYSNDTLQLRVGGELAVQAVKDGAVSLRYDAGESLRTSSTGVEVTQASAQATVKISGNTANNASLVDLIDGGSSNYWRLAMRGTDHATESDDLVLTYYDGSFDAYIRCDISNSRIALGQPLILPNGTSINEFSTDGTMVGNSDDAVPTEKAVKEYVDSYAQGIDWQESVLSRSNYADSTADIGFRYIATDSGGTWTINNIYEYNGSTWDESVITEGGATWVEDEDSLYVFNGTTWVKFGSTSQHNNMSGIQGGTSNEYYHLTSAQHTDLTDSGDTTLHYHAEDRDRANHTGVASVSKETTSSASYTIDSTSAIELLFCSLGSNQTITLPAATEQDQIKIAKTASGGTLTIQRAGSDTIEGNTSIALTAQYQSVTLISDGTSTWYEF